MEAIMRKKIFKGVVLSSDTFYGFGKIKGAKECYFVFEEEGTMEIKLRVASRRFIKLSVKNLDSCQLWIKETDSKDNNYLKIPVFSAGKRNRCIVDVSQVLKESGFEWEYKTVYDYMEIEVPFYEQVKCMVEVDILETSGVTIFEAINSWIIDTFISFEGGLLLDKAAKKIFSFTFCRKLPENIQSISLIRTQTLSRFSRDMWVNNTSEDFSQLVRLTLQKAVSDVIFEVGLYDNLGLEFAGGYAFFNSKYGVKIQLSKIGDEVVEYAGLEKEKIFGRMMYNLLAGKDKDLVSMYKKALMEARLGICDPQGSWKVAKNDDDDLDINWI